MNFSQLYEQFAALEDPGFWQTAYMNFYRAWFEGNRWMQYFEGLGVTILVTIIALLIGVVLGVLVAVVRTGHDQQRKGHHNPILAVLNMVCKVYVTVIRGTPMMVQLLIMGFVIFASSRNKTLIGALSLGINSGAYVAEIIRGGLMSLDPGQSEAGRSLGLGYLDTMRFIVIPQAFKAILPALGNEFITLLKDTSLISVVAGTEIVYFAQAIVARTYEPMWPYLITAVMYLILVLIFSWLCSYFSRLLICSGDHAISSRLETVCTALGSANIGFRTLFFRLFS